MHDTDPATFRIHSPIWKPEVTAGNLISWLLAIFVAGGAVFVLKYQVDQLIVSNDLLQNRVDAYQKQSQDQLIAFETITNSKIASLESSIADARVTNAEVRGSVQAIERDVANILRQIEAMTRERRMDQFRGAR